MSGRLIPVLSICLAVGAWLVGPVETMAQDTWHKTKVEVRFVVAETDYTETYPAEELPVIEWECARRIKQTLSHVYRFVDFVDSNGANQLMVKLGLTYAERAVQKDLPADFQGEIPGNWHIYLRIGLSGPEVFGNPQEVTWLFRTKHQISTQTLPEAADLIDEIGDFFAWRLQPETAPDGADTGSGDAVSELVDGVFCKLLLAKDAHPIQDIPAWLLPFSMQEWGIGRTSKLMVFATVTSGSVFAEAAYQVSARGRYADTNSSVPLAYPEGATLANFLTPDSGEEVRSAEQVDGVAFTLIDYVAPMTSRSVNSPFDLIREEDNP